MTHAIAIDWDAQEVRYVSANLVGKRIANLQAGCVEIVAEPDASGRSQDIGTLLATALDARKLRSARLLVAVPRGDVELLPLTLPPAKDEELPLLVANEAQRQTSLATEDAVVDFLALNDPADGPRQVTAAVLTKQRVKQIMQDLHATRNKPQRLLLRRPALVSLASRIAELGDAPCLVVNRTVNEVELSIVVSGRDVFSRYFRLPAVEDLTEVSDRLMAEITRTLTAAPTEAIGSRGVERIFLFAAPGEYDELLETLRSELELDAEALDAFAELDAAPGEIPADPGKYAALLGMLMDETADSHAIDFLHPRRPPRKTSRWKMVAAACGVAAVIVLGLAMHFWGTIAEIQQENRELYIEVKTLNESIKKAEDIGKRVQALAAWKAREVNWLDELRDLSIRVPSQRDVVVARMSMRPGQKTAGRIDLQGVMRDSNVLVKLETGIRDEYRTVRSRQIRERLSDQDFTWLFETSVTVDRRKADAYVSHLPDTPDPPAARLAEPETVGPETTVPVSTVVDTPQEETP